MPQWEVIRPLLPPPGGGRPRKTDIREVVNAILYVLRSGCAWDLLPHDFPPPGTVYDYFSQWRRKGMSVSVRPGTTFSVQWGPPEWLQRESFEGGWNEG